MFSFSAETRINAKFASASPVELECLLHDFPKGGELHCHLLGALYSEWLLDWAISHSLFVDTTTLLFSDQPSANSVPASNLLSDKELYTQVLNILSMRGKWLDDQLPHDHFMYKSFSPIDSITQYIPPQDMLNHLLEYAKREKVSYLEVMVGQAAAEALSALPEFPSNVRLIIELSRCNNDPASFETAVTNAATTILGSNGRVVSFNIVGPEDDLVARTQFKNQIETIQRVVQGSFPVTLHGGELTETLADPDSLKDRIKTTISVADRIGHAVSIAKEDDAFATMTAMAKRQIPVEVCLSSNKGILAVSGRNHPLNLYLKHKVPVVLCTDDPAVNRSGFTAQFVQAVLDHGLTYSQLKECARNSILFSFLPDEEKKSFLQALDKEFDDYERRF